MIPAKHPALLLVLLLLGGNAFAYSCEDLAAENRKVGITRQDLGGFESIDQKLTTIMNMTFEALTASVAEMQFKELLSQGASQSSAYVQSVNVAFREMLKAEAAARARLDLAIREAGGVNQLVTGVCKGRKSEIGALFRAFYLHSQEVDAKK